MQFMRDPARSVTIPARQAHPPVQAGVHQPDAEQRSLLLLRIVSGCPPTIRRSCRIGVPRLVPPGRDEERESRPHSHRDVQDREVGP
jgi:hypothetical protein